MRRFRYLLLLLSVLLPAGAQVDRPAVRRPVPEASRPNAEPRREGERENDREELRDRPFAHVQQEFHGVLIETPEVRREHEAFRAALQGNDAVAAAARLKALIHPGDWESSEGRALAGELRVRIRAESSAPAKRSLNALLKYVAWGRVEFLPGLVAKSLQTRARFADPALSSATPAQIGSRPLYVADGIGLATVDSGPPLRAAIRAGHTAGRLVVRRMLDEDLALYTPDVLTIEATSGRAHLIRRTTDRFPPDGPGLACDSKLPADASGACVVFLILPGSPARK